MKKHTGLAIALSLVFSLTVVSFSQTDHSAYNKQTAITETRINQVPLNPDFAIYDFSQFNSTFTSIVNASGEVVLGTGVMDDQTYANRNIGFTFTFDSTAYTTFGVSANAYIVMGSGAVPTSYTLLNSAQNDCIAAFDADLLSYAGTGRVSYVVQGAPPIRVLTIQWTDFGFYTGTGGDSSHSNIQMKLYEGSNIVQFVYGTSTSSSTQHNVQVGMKGNSISDVSSRSTITDWSATTPGTSASTCLFRIGVTPPSGLTFQWAPPAVVSFVCESFSSTNFPPIGWSVTAAGTSYLSRSAVSSYCLGTGSLKFDFFNWASGTQSFTSPIFPAVVSGNGCDSLRFSHAKSGNTGGTDVMQIQTSTNGGATWAELVLLSTQLNTAPPQGTAFTPSCSQWNRKAYALPNGTNRIRFNATTVHDNNLYLDSICVVCLTGVENSNNQLPVKYSIGQNYPNPFNPVTKIEYQLPANGFVTLKVYDILGHEVTTLVNETQSRGTHDATFDGANLSSGVYFYEIQVRRAGSSAELFTERKKMVLLK